MIPIFIMLVGLPASGKTYFTNKYRQQGYKIHSSDDIRVELFGDVNYMGNNGLVFQTLHDRVREDLQKGYNVVYDACNIKYKSRANFLTSISDILCDKACYFMCTPYEKCLERNKARERQVPEKVIKDMYHNFDIPMYFEGWHFIDIKYPDKVKYSESKLLRDMLLFNQETSTHAHTLGKHCLLTMESISEQLEMLGKEDGNLTVAGYYHDIGKMKVKHFTEGKENAQYWNHENVGAYDFLLYAHPYFKGDLGLREDILDIAQLIRFHMLFFNQDILTDPKLNEKWRNRLGDKFMERLMILHKGDRAAH
jgi:predicted kinase